MRSQKSIFLAILVISTCLFLAEACSPQGAPSTSFSPTAANILPTTTPNPTETRISEPSQTPLLNPIAMGYHRMAYDSESDKVILWGGQPNKKRTFNTETWAFDFNTKTWQMLVTDITPSRGEGPMAYDSQSDRIILFLGATVTLAPMMETWAYDFNTNTWRNMKPEVSPYGMLGARMAYDSESDRIILFGGDSKTWSYDFESNTWSLMEHSGKPPQGSNFFAMSYDTDADRVIMWRCPYGESGNTIGIYDYNSNVWETKETEIYPAHCDYNGMVFDPETGLNILFGGVKGSDESPTNETWGYDYSSNSWTPLETHNPPAPRGWHAMIYHTRSARVVLFGGGASRDEFTDETWVYDPSISEWNIITINSK